jgi:hypothetical protein
VAASGLAGCGGADVATPTTPEAATAAAPAPADTTTAPVVPTTPAPATPTTTAAAPTETMAGEAQAGGAGDEQGTRVPAAFTAEGAALSPARITVAAFLPVRLSVRAAGADQHVTVATPEGATLTVPAGTTASRLLPGLPAGDYPVSTAAGGRAILHVVPGGDPGP